MSVAVKQFGVRQLFVFHMTSDTAPGTWATGQRYVGVKKIGFAREIASVIQEGDDAILFVSRQNKAINFTVEISGVNLPIQALIQGATLTEIAAVVGPPEVLVSTHMIVGVEDQPAAFGLIAKILGKKGGCAHVCLYNCIETEGGLVEAAMDAFAGTSWTGKAMACPEDEKALLAVRHWAVNNNVSTTWATNLVTDVTP